jgi:guanine nucleotide-binding protein subunit beta-2-like 1 protein
MEKVESGEEREFLISGSKDSSIIAWEITPKDLTDDDKEWGIATRKYMAHDGSVTDFSLSQDNKYCISSSWDCNLILWDLESVENFVTFEGQYGDEGILSCTFSLDGKQIISKSMDRIITIWDTTGERKHTIREAEYCYDHSDWVSSVQFSPDAENPVFATTSWDGTIKVWESDTFTLKNSFNGHTNAVNNLDFASGSHYLASGYLYLASGGKDGKINLWNVKEESLIKHKEHDASINQVSFSPVKYWIAAATENGIIVWNHQEDTIIARITGECTSITWNIDGTLLFAGFTDNLIKVYEVVEQ